MQSVSIIFGGKSCWHAPSHKAPTTGKQRRRLARKQREISAQLVSRFDQLIIQSLIKSCQPHS